MECNQLASYLQEAMLSQENNHSVIIMYFNDTCIYYISSESTAIGQTEIYSTDGHAMHVVVVLDYFKLL